MTERVGTGGSEVIVVGAGPVGLTLACELKRHGVGCRLIDNKEGPTPLAESRALGLQARTLEVFRNVGVIEQVLAHARRVHGISAYSGRKRLIHFAFDLEGVETPYPFILILPQAQTERFLLDRFAELGGEVEWGTALDSFSGHAGHVAATLSDRSGVKTTVDFPWLVGCDGPRSLVRHGLDLSFEGGEYEERFLLADLHVSWQFPDDELTILITPEGPVAAFPLPEPGRWRLVDTTGVVDSNDPAEIVERFRVLVTTYADPAAVVDDPVWTSSFHIHKRVVDRYRAGPCFVAGDAAHLHSPVGGQGMNTGVQDAYNLAWKLALVVKGDSPDALLDSYGVERKPVAAGVLRGSDVMTRVVTLRGEVARHVRDRLMGVLGEFDFVRKRISVGMSELGVNYRGSPIVAEDRDDLLHAILPHRGSPGLGGFLDFRSAPHPGDRAPDVVLDDERRSRLFDLLTDTRHVLLVFIGVSPLAGDEERIRGVSRRLEGFSETIACWLVASPDSSDVAGWSGGVLPDPTGAAHRSYGASAPCLYLIRPDGYIGYRALPIDPEKLGEYLDGIFTPRG